MRYFKEPFTLMATNGKTITMDLLEKQNFVLYFYPKDQTSACTIEALEFASLYDDRSEERRVG